MRPKLLLLALCLCALGVMLGQNEPALVGLPELGVTFTGTAEHPEIVSNSGRGILGYVILSRDANGRESFMPTLKTRDMRLALVRPAPVSGPIATPPRASFDNGGPPVQAILDAVIFDNLQARTVGNTSRYYRVRSMASALLRRQCWARRFLGTSLKF